MVRSFTPDHGMRDSPQIFVPDIRMRQQLRDRVTFEYLRCKSFRSCFRGNGLGAVLAKLRYLSLIIWIRPGTTRTIKPIFLIDLQERLKTALDPHVAEAELCRLINCDEPGSRFRTFT